MCVRWCLASGCNPPGLECHVAGLVGPLHHDQQLEPLPGEVLGRHVVEGGGLVDDVDDVQRPDEEDAGLRGGVGQHRDVLHLLVHLTNQR